MDVSLSSQIVVIVKHIFKGALVSWNAIGPVAWCELASINGVATYRVSSI